MNCWQCGNPVAPAEHLCPQCRYLQPPRPQQTHFERLEVAESFDQDLDVLAKHHRRLQRTFHPDRFASQDEKQRRLSLEHATALNDAYRILRDPCRRADYMLILKGMDVIDERNQVKLQPFFLMEVLELREAMEELGGPDTHAERGRITTEVAQRYESTLGTLGSGLDSGIPSIETLAQCAAQLKYLKKILDDLHLLAG